MRYLFTIFNNIIHAMYFYEYNVGEGKLLLKKKKHLY